MSDASHGGERPMAGHMEEINGGPVAWYGGRLPLTPLSVAEGEYCIATKSAVAAISIHNKCKFAGEKMDAPAILFCDNKAAVQLADGNSSSKRMKHIATRIAFLRERIAAKEIMLYHIGTSGQVADIFTKDLTAAVFHELRQFLVT